MILQHHKLLFSVRGAWSLWSSWGNCSVTCENGTRTRTRVCNHPPPNFGGRECPDTDIEYKPCTMIMCPGMSYFYRCTFFFSIITKCTKTLLIYYHSLWNIFYVNYVQLYFNFFFRGNLIVECWINNMENLFIGINTFNSLFTDFTTISLFCAFTEVHKKIITHWLSSFEEKICSNSHFIVANSQYQTEFQF